MSGEETVFTDLFSESIAGEDGPHHSTPIKDGPFKRPPKLGRVTARVEPSSPGRHVVSEADRHNRLVMNKHQHSHQQAKQSTKGSPRGMSSSPRDESTVQKQRHEIQLLIQELRDRDSELNETVSAHSQQLLVWERDRQRLLMLEQKNARYENELQKKKKQLEAAMLKLKAARGNEQNNSTSLNVTQEQLDRLSKEKQNSDTQLETLEKQNVSLNSSLKAMCGSVGQLEAREQELITLLRLKEKESEQATSNILDLNSRIQLLDIRCQECQNREAEALHRATQWKQKHTQARSEIEKLSDILQSRDNELIERGKEIAGLRQQVALLQEEMLITVERERRKDGMIESLRAKQERTQAELRSVRELYERQQREITLMQLNLDSSKENSNQNSNLDYSISLDDSISCQSNYSVQHVSPWQRDVDLETRQVSFEERLPRQRDVDAETRQVSFEERLPRHRDVDAETRQVSFEERLSTFLDEDTDMEAMSHLDASPASKLQRLLTESRQMIENLEKTTLPPSTPAAVTENTQYSERSPQRSQNIQFTEQLPENTQNSQIAEQSTWNTQYVERLPQLTPNFKYAELSPQMSQNFSGQKVNVENCHPANLEIFHNSSRESHPSQDGSFQVERSSRTLARSHNCHTPPPMSVCNESDSADIIREQVDSPES